MTNKTSAFSEHGLRATIDSLSSEIQELYVADDIPWIVGYSGGKDSSTVLSLVWNAVQALPESQRKKEVHVISTDTLVENPIVAAWVNDSLKACQSRQIHRACRSPPIGSRLKSRTPSG